MIKIGYRAADGFAKTYTFQTIAGAQRKAAALVGSCPDMGSDYAVSFDGIGTVRAIEGCKLAELFPSLEGIPIETGAYSVIGLFLNEDTGQSSRLVLDTTDTLDEALQALDYQQRRDAADGYELAGNNQAAKEILSAARKEWLAKEAAAFAANGTVF